MSQQKIYTVISATGSYIPTREVSNSEFLDAQFYDSENVKIQKENQEIVTKLEEITGIVERRYVTDDLVTSDIAYFAALDALESSGIDRESLDYLIVAHNFGDVRADNRRSDLVPSLAARVKHKLKIHNPYTVAYDLPFGCPGWLQGVIQADYFIKSGDAKRALVIGAETLSRVSDPHDRDRMIYADGAGATILEARESDTPVGIMAHSTRSDTQNEAYMLWMDKSFKADNGDELYLKMNGHKLYLYAIKTVPTVVKECLDKCNLGITDIHKVLIHQANAKMDEAILKRLYKLYGNGNAPLYVMPMIISRLGNSSVATLPTLLDKMVKGNLPTHHIDNGDNVVFASVGAGMNINAMVYRTP